MASEKMKQIRQKQKNSQHAVGCWERFWISFSCEGRYSSKHISYRTKHSFVTILHMFFLFPKNHLIFWKEEKHMQYSYKTLFCSIWNMFWRGTAKFARKRNSEPFSIVFGMSIMPLNHADKTNPLFGVFLGWLLWKNVI